MWPRLPFSNINYIKMSRVATRPNFDTFLEWPEFLWRKHAMRPVTLSQFPTYARRGNGIPRAIGKIASNKNGSIAIIFAMSAVPVLALIGCSLDYARAIAVKERIQIALDAAVLAARNEASASQIAAATNYFEGNAPRAHGATVSVSFLRAADGGLSGTANAEVKTTFARIMNLKSIPVRAIATATADVTQTTTTTTMTTETKVIPGTIPCIHVMSQSANPAWKLISNSDLNASSCVAKVRSNGAAALTSDSSSNVKFKQILVKGGASVISGPITIVDAPNKIFTDAKDEVVGDPFSGGAQGTEFIIAWSLMSPQASRAPCGAGRYDESPPHRCAFRSRRA